MRSSQKKEVRGSRPAQFGQFNLSIILLCCASEDRVNSETVVHETHSCGMDVFSQKRFHEFRQQTTLFAHGAIAIPVMHKGIGRV